MGSNEISYYLSMPWCNGNLVFLNLFFKLVYLRTQQMRALVAWHTYLCARREPVDHIGKVSSQQFLKRTKQAQGGWNTAARASVHYTSLGSSVSHGVPALERKNTAQYIISGMFPSLCKLMGRHNTRSCMYTTWNWTAKHFPGSGCIIMCRLDLTENWLSWKIREFMFYSIYQESSQTAMSNFVFLKTSQSSLLSIISHSVFQ